MANEVAAWLADKDKKYADGLAIYNKYKLHNKHDKFFNSVEDPQPNSRPFKILVQQIDNINRKLLQKPAKVKPSKAKTTIEVTPINPGAEKKSSNAKRPTVVENPLVDVKELPEDLKQKYFENKEFTRQLGGKHQELKAIGADSKFDDKRKALASEITSLDEQRAENWKAIDTWWKQKQEGKGQNLDSRKTLLQNANKINNLKNYINRTNKALETPEKVRDITKTKAKLAEWQRELDELTRTK